MSFLFSLACCCVQSKAHVAESSFPKLLVALCKDDPKASLSNQQALAKQMGDVFDFVLRFDDAKVDTSLAFQVHVILPQDG